MAGMAGPTEQEVGAWFATVQNQNPYARNDGLVTRENGANLEAWYAKAFRDRFGMDMSQWKPDGGRVQLNQNQQAPVSQLAGDRWSGGYTAPTPRVDPGFEVPMRAQMRLEEASRQLPSDYEQRVAAMQMNRPPDVTGRPVGTPQPLPPPRTETAGPPGGTAVRNLDPNGPKIPWDEMPRIVRKPGPNGEAYESAPSRAPQNGLGNGGRTVSGHTRMDNGDGTETYRISQPSAPSRATETRSQREQPQRDERPAQRRPPPDRFGSWRRVGSSHGPNRVERG